jgi:hypothetical protein
MKKKLPCHLCADQRQYRHVVGLEAGNQSLPDNLKTLRPVAVPGQAKTANGERRPILDLRQAKGAKAMSAARFWFLRPRAL